MDTGTFQSLLRKCNKNLYIQLDRVNINTGMTGIYLRNFAERDVDPSLSRMFSGEDSRIVHDILTRTDEHVASVSVPFVKEGDELNEKMNAVKKPGWRSILKRLITKGYIKAERAARVFGYCESPYDRMSPTQKAVFEGLCQQP